MRDGKTLWASEQDETRWSVRGGLRRLPWGTFGMAVLCVGVGVLSGWWIASPSDAGRHAMQTGAQTLSLSTGKTQPPRGTDRMYVDVHGDVLHPGMYALPLGSRVADAIAAAGGYRQSADAAAINEAPLLTDGQEVLVPAAGTVPPVSESSPSKGAVPSTNGAPALDSTSLADKIDLNTASKSTLQTLPGIGPARAEAIVSYREQHGPFRDVTTLRQVPGIGTNLFQRIAPYLIVTSVPKP